MWGLYVGALCGGSMWAMLIRPSIRAFCNWRSVRKALYVELFMLGACVAHIWPTT